MIEGKDILPFSYYKKGKPFTGSYKGMRYRIIKEGAVDEDDTDKLKVDIWPEPLCFEVTPDEKITSQRFAFTDDGYKDVVKYLNDMHEDYNI